MLIFFTVIFFIILLAVLYFFLQGAPFMPTRPAIVEKMVALAQIKAGKKAVDLGAGDGRIVLALAKAGAEAHGYEINPLLVWWARRKIHQAGLEDRAFIHFKSFWGVNLGDFDVITIFGISHIMSALSKKLQKEKKPGARIISYAFPLKKWSYYQKDGAVYLYQ